MNRLRFGFLSLGLLLAVSAAQAQEMRVKASIPFDFAVGKQILPAGEYTLVTEGSSNDAVVIRSDDGQSQTLSWAAGKALTAWPGALPLKNGASYSVEWPDGGDSSKLDVVTIASPPTDLVGAAQVLLENGCQKQLDLLVESASKTGN